MRSAIRSVALLVPVVALLFVGACAKRPDMRVTAAPAPAPAPQAAPAPAPPPPVAAAPAPAAPAPPPVVAAAPAPPPAVPKEFEPNQALRPIHFDFDASEILDADKPVLDRKAGVLGANRPIRIRIEGNTDERGSDEYNLALGMRRAAAAKLYLTQRGIDATRIETASYGEERPVCQEHDESCWAKNRRAEFAVLAGNVTTIVPER